MNEKANAGINVEIICNRDFVSLTLGNNLDPKIKFHSINGIHRSSLMHNKFCVIDFRVVITGSYNWSRKAKNHFENLVVVENDDQLSFQYLKEFVDLMHHFDYESRPKMCARCKNRRVTRFGLETYAEDDCLHQTYVLEYCWGENDYDVVDVVSEQIFSEQFVEVEAHYPPGSAGVIQRLSDYSNNDVLYKKNESIIKEFELNMLVHVGYDNEESNVGVRPEENAESVIVHWRDVFHRKFDHDVIQSERIMDRIRMETRS